MRTFRAREMFGTAFSLNTEARPIDGFVAICKLVTLTIAILVLTTYAMAQDVVVPKGQLPLRQTPPGTFFQGKGDQVGTVLPRESYRVLERKAVPTIAGTEQWLKVQSVENPTKQGWIYAGRDDRQTVSPR